MTETRRPDPCHYDRHLKQRVTKRHRQDCTTRTCDGCAPCTAPHCPTCTRGHLDNTHPQTCVNCVRTIREDLTAIIDADHALRLQARDGGANGRLVAAAPIPGGTAQVLTGPSIPLEVMRTYTSYVRDHRPKDPIPPLALLAHWEDRWRAWLHLDRTALAGDIRFWFGTDPAGRATLTRTCLVLRDDVIPVVAQDDPANGGPELPEMAGVIRHIRDQLERTLHNEQDGDEGVTCFECDGTLVRRYRRPNRCACPPRPILRHADHGRCDCLTGVRHEYDERGHLTVTHLRDLDPDDGHTHPPADHCCLACHREAAWDAMHAGHNQGGLSDPTVGMSWECPGCRKTYDPGEYQNAVRADLARKNGGWITIPVAAEGAQAVAGRPIGEKTIRSWVVRDWVKSEFVLNARGIPGPRMVLWADVRREAERVGAGRNQCTHATPAREWVKVVASYPELAVDPDAVDEAVVVELGLREEEHDATREMCGRCADAVAATLRQARSSSGRIGA